ncbi:hypothetical protein SAMN05444157_0743 [Frankineae bacterium MT45]|nr:hypothetical protein SAMN05444157_0743 [Frankineae bacterium MT45]
MTAHLFPDNTVLCNFASVHRLDLLRSVLNGNGRWTEAIAYEASRSAAYLPDLRTLASDGWLGEPIEFESDADVAAVERLRRSAFGGTSDAPLQHLGEAQTCHLLLSRPEFAGAWWISDDREALRFARFRGITTWETSDLLELAATNGDETPTVCRELRELIVQRGSISVHSS